MKDREIDLTQINDFRCKENTIKMIDKNTCKNNCKYFKYDKDKGKRVCVLGYI